MIGLFFDLLLSYLPSFCCGSTILLAVVLVWLPGKLLKEGRKRREMKKTVVMGADHGGFEQKEALGVWLKSEGYHVVDCGTYDAVTSVDYPDYAHAVIKRISDGEALYGVLVCGTGLGMAVAANKVAGIRAVPVTSVGPAQRLPWWWKSCPARSGGARARPTMS